jgi:hypothetical protein
MTNAHFRCSFISYWYAIGLDILFSLFIHYILQLMTTQDEHCREHFPTLFVSFHPSLNFLMSHTGICTLILFNFTIYNTLSPRKSYYRTFLYQWRRLLDTLHYYYSKDNENQQSANEGGFILLVSAIFLLLPVSLFRYTENCIYFFTFPCIIYFVYCSMFSAYMWYMDFC